MDKQWLTEAVSNNATWCDAIVASHRLSTHRSGVVWYCEYPVPPLYPNIITLTKGNKIDEYIKSIDRELASGWGIKDSFSEFELEPRGFVPAFEAHWYCRPPNASGINEYKVQLPLNTVKTQAELDRWVCAWGNGNAIFNASLLKNKAIELVYAEYQGELVAGMATNQSNDSVGISNVFGSIEAIIGCVATIVQRYPKKAIVGYGDKEEVEVLSVLGFQELGDLRVWLRR